MILDKMDDRPRIPGRNGGTLLKRVKGDPPSPGAGKPKGSKNVKTILKQILEGKVSRVNPLSGEVENTDLLKHMLYAQISKAINKGQDTAAFIAVLDRLEGKPKQQTEISGPEGGPIQGDFRIVTVAVQAPISESEEDVEL